jgi:hypothetical protein
MRSALVVLALLLTAQAHADSLERGLIAASVADFASTELVLRTCGGCYERNPLGQSTGSRLALKAAGGFVTVGAYRWLRPRHPKAAKLLTISLIVLYSGATANNLRRAR